MKANLSLADIEAMLARGELPNTRPGETMAELKAELGEVLRVIVAGLIGIPLSRLVKVEILDVGIDGKMGVMATFDPELNETEGALYHAAMRAVAAFFGSRPPMLIADA